MEITPKKERKAIELSYYATGEFRTRRLIYKSGRVEYLAAYELNPRFGPHPTNWKTLDIFNTEKECDEYLDKVIAHYNDTILLKATTIRTYSK